MLNAAEEIRFWTGIMSNHGEFILASLSYTELEAIQQAKHYRDTFASFHEQAGTIDMTKDPNALNTLVSACINLLSSFINFKKFCYPGFCSANSIRALRRPSITI